MVFVTYHISITWWIVDIRNKLLCMPVTEELPGGFNGEKVGKLSSGGINKEIKQAEQGAR